MSREDEEIKGHFECVSDEGEHVKVFLEFLSDEGGEHLKGFMQYLNDEGLIETHYDKTTKKKVRFITNKGKNVLKLLKILNGDYEKGASINMEFDSDKLYRYKRKGEEAKMLCCNCFVGACDERGCIKETAEGKCECIIAH